MKSLSAMRLIDIVPRSSLRVPLLGRTKESIFSELVDGLGLDAGQEQLKKTILESVMEREKSLSTSIGSGVAIPHGKAEIDTRVLGAMGVLPTPVPYDSIDGEPVRAVVLVVTRPEDSDSHLDALRAVSLLLSKESTRDAVFRCRDSSSLWDVLHTV